MFGGKIFSDNKRGRRKAKGSKEFNCLKERTEGKNRKIEKRSVLETIREGRIGIHRSITLTSMRR